MWGQWYQIRVTTTTTNSTDKTMEWVAHRAMHRVTVLIQIKIDTRATSSISHHCTSQIWVGWRRRRTNTVHTIVNPPKISQMPRRCTTWVHWTTNLTSITNSYQPLKYRCSQLKTKINSSTTTNSIIRTMGQTCEANRNKIAKLWTPKNFQEFE